MLLEEKKLLPDMKSSIESVDEFLGPERDFNQSVSNKILKRAVERELEIIGEAANRLLKMNATV